MPHLKSGHACISQAHEQADESAAQGTVRRATRWGTRDTYAVFGVREAGHLTPLFRSDCHDVITGWFRFLVALGCAAAVLALGLAALMGAFGGGSRAPSAAPTTTSSTIVSVQQVGPNKQPLRVTVPDVIGETQADATETLATAGLGTSAATEDVDDGTPIGSVVTESPWPGSQVVPGSVVSIKVVAGA